MKEIPIPLPPIELQKEIVRILDTFSELIAELQAELILRKKQYEYYLNMLLSEKYLNEAIRKVGETKEKRELYFYKLQEIFYIRNGYTPSKFKEEYWKEGEIPWFRMDDIRKNGNTLHDAILHVSKSAVKGELFKANSIILATSATIGEHALITIDFLANQRFTCFTLKDEFLNDINIKYVYYCFYLIDEWCKKNTKLGNFQSVDIDKLVIQKIAIPDISIQEKIVKVLDKFQELIEQAKGALPEEISLRQKQYEYYREALLTFNGKCARERVISNHFFVILNEAAQIVGVDLYSIEKKKISDLCKRQKGINITARQMKEFNKSNGSIKVFAGGDTVAYFDDIGEEPIRFPSVIVKSRGNIDFEFYDRAFTHKNELWSYSAKDERHLNTKFLYYYLKNNVKYFKDTGSITGTMPQISVGITDNFLIPLPPFSVQQHVVDILDKFNTLTTDLKQGLPAEINLREKQYEYYREALLSFSH